jgi:hypothetical protein
MHPETKFRGGEADQRGTLTRRHVLALSHRSIGKESDGLEENEYIGEDQASLKSPTLSEDRRKLLQFIASTQAEHRISDRTLVETARVSHHTLAKLRNGLSIDDKSLENLVRAANHFIGEALLCEVAKKTNLEDLRQLHMVFGSRNALARHLGVSGPYLGRVLSGEKPITAALAGKINLAIREVQWN